MKWLSKLFGVESLPESTAIAPIPGPAVEALLAESAASADRGDFAAAQVLLHQALEQSPNNVRVLVRSARLYRRAGLHSEALHQYDIALPLTDQPGQIQTEIGETFFEMKDVAAAIDAFTVAVTLEPTAGEAWMRLGDALSRFDRVAEALEAYEQATELVGPELALGAWMRRGQALHVLGRLEEALTAFSRCIEIEPCSVDAWMASGHIHLLVEQDEQALACYRRALELSPTRPTPLLMHLAMAHQGCGQWHEAQRLLEEATTASPADHVARWYLCQCDLTLCNWPRGWANYGSRFAAGATPYRPLPFRQWRGEPAPNDTLLILADQGIGDEIMFASCFSDALARVRHCVIECEPRLEALFRRSFPSATIIPSDRRFDGRWLEGAPEPTLQIFGGDLPALFRQNDAAFAACGPYLRPDPELVAHWKERLEADLGHGLKVGLSWRGGTPATRTRTRTMRPADLAPLLRTSNCRFVNLQYGDYGSELAELQRHASQPILDYPEAQRDQDQLAALVVALDVITTVCTSLVHLTGALGRPVYVLTPYSPTWRYTADRDRLPWYASCHLYRQQSIGDWAMPCRKLSDDLASMAGSVMAQAAPRGSDNG